MAIQRTITHYANPVEIKLPEIFVVAFLADASGNPVTEATRANAVYIKTELYDNDDEAWSRFDDITSKDDEPLLFASCQNQNGESIV